MSEALRKAAEQALAALKTSIEFANHMGVGGWQPTAMQCHEAVASLKAALAEPEQEQEPVAWRKRMLQTDYDYDGNDWRFSESGFIEPEGQEPLFTRPPRREPLSDERYFEIGQRHWLSSAKIAEIHKEIETALRSKPGAPNA